jgi:hypothetical protein
MLRQPDGTPINGPYTMTFRLYDDPVVAGALYSETLKNVMVRDGLFTVLLGDVTPINTALFKQPLYVGIQVENDAEMAPRQRLAPVPYAVQLTDGVYVDAAGNVGIGKTDPAAQLDVGGDLAVSGAVLGNLAVNGKITSAATGGGDSATTVTTKGYVDTKWPDGPYCILRGGTYDSPAACPAGFGFTEGHICFDTEDDDNRDRTDGTIGASRIGAQSVCGTGSGGSIRLEFCCKD